MRIQSSPHARHHTRSLVAAWVLIGVLASPAESQSWKDRLKRVAASAAGVDGALDAIEVRDALAEAKEATKYPSLLAGTYRLTYVYNRSDSITYYVRAFERPAIGHVNQVKDRPLGYTLTTVAAPTLDSLPATWREAAERGDRIGGGPLIVWPFPGDSVSERRFVVSWIVALPKGVGTVPDRFRKIVSDMHGGSLIRDDGSKLPGYDEVRETDAFARLAPDGALRVRYSLARKRHRLTVLAERLSTERLANDDNAAQLP